MELFLNKILDEAELIHYFGLGFIQVKMNRYERYHFYDSSLPVTVQDEEIHNHRYNFVSEIVLGKLSQTFYEVGDYQSIFTHLLSEETCNANIKSNTKETPISIINSYDINYKVGEKYFMDHRTFHTVKSDLAVTYLKRGHYQKENAEVIRKKDSELLCPFSIEMSQEDLKDRIKVIVKKLRTPRYIR